MVNEFTAEDDVPIPTDILGIPDDCEPRKSTNLKIVCLIERGELDRAMGRNVCKTG